MMKWNDDGVRDHLQFSLLISSEFKGTVMQIYNNKYMTASIQVINTEIFVFTVILVFKFLSRKGFDYTQKRQ